MTTSIAELVSQAPELHHHALLLTCSRFSEGNQLPAQAFKSLAQAFCGLSLRDPEDEESFWQESARHPDVFIADRERNTLRLEELGQLRHVAMYPPTYAKRRLFFIDRAERLNLHAANAILKVIEEPPSPSFFLLTAKRASEVLQTIASRCLKMPVHIEGFVSEPLESHFEPADVSFLAELFERMGDHFPSLPNSLRDRGIGHLPASQLSVLVSRAEEIGKRYPARDLQDLLMSFISKSLKKDLQALPLCRLLKSEVIKWRHFEGFNPSGQLWLLRVFVLLALSRSKKN